MANASKRAVVSVVGPDQKGVVARFTTLLAESGLNIEDLEQQVASGVFLMDLVVDCHDAATDLATLRGKLDELAASLGMRARLIEAQPAEPKRIVVVDAGVGVLTRKLLGLQPDHRSVIAGVVGVRPTDARVLAVAAEAEVERMSLGDPEDASGYQQLVERFAPDLLVIGPSLPTPPAEVIQALPGRILATYPTLQPCGATPDAWEATWRLGARISGGTAYFVEGPQRGPIVAQVTFQINVGHDGPEQLRKHGEQAQTQALVEAATMAIDERLQLVDGLVVRRPGLSRLFEHRDW